MSRILTWTLVLCFILPVARAEDPNLDTKKGMLKEKLDALEVAGVAYGAQTDPEKEKAFGKIMGEKMNAVQEEIKKQLTGKYGIGKDTTMEPFVLVNGKTVAPSIKFYNDKKPILTLHIEFHPKGGEPYFQAFTPKEPTSTKLPADASAAASREEGLVRHASPTPSGAHN